MTHRKVGILVFPEVEVLDFCGPFEVFSVTRLDEDAGGKSRHPMTLFWWRKGKSLSPPRAA